MESQEGTLDKALEEMEKAGWPCRLVEAPARIRELEQQIVTLNEALRIYGQHQAECRIVYPTYCARETCSCGLDTALATVRGEKDDKIDTYACGCVRAKGVFATRCRQHDQQAQTSEDKCPNHDIPYPRGCVTCDRIAKTGYFHAVNDVGECEPWCEWCRKDRAAVHEEPKS